MKLVLLTFFTCIAFYANSQTIDSLKQEYSKNLSIETKLEVVNELTYAYYDNFGEYPVEEALNFYDEAFKWAEKMDNPYYKYIFHIRLGYIYKCIGEYEKAKYHALLGYELANKNKDHRSVSIGGYIIAMIYIDKREYLEAQKQLLANLIHLKKNPNSFFLVRITC